MDSLAVIEQFDIAEDCCPGTFSTLEVCMMNEFVLQVREEAFSHRIVMGTAF
jgi:hypothetical protein